VEEEAENDSELKISVGVAKILIENNYYNIELGNPGYIKLSDNNANLLDGDIKLQLWPDARSISVGGHGSVRLADFRPEGWKIEERTDNHCVVVLSGYIPKYAQYSEDVNRFDVGQQFDFEIEIHCYSFSPVIRYKWRINNHTPYTAYLERYAIEFPITKDIKVNNADKAEDKYLRWINFEVNGNIFSVVSNFIDSLGEGAGMSLQKTLDICEISKDELDSITKEKPFEPHVYTSSGSAISDDVVLIQGGINPPVDGNLNSENPDVHRIFYRGMGRTFEGAFIVNSNQDRVSNELNKIYFELEPNYYSIVGVLPEAGDEVYFGKFKDQIFKTAEYLLKTQWKGNLWWGEWWREWDVNRKQGVQATANGNNALAPLFHYFRTGDARFIECAKMAMEFAYDIQLSKRRTGLGPFFQSRKFLIDNLQWVHMRYQRIAGIMLASHFFGDTRLRKKVLDAMKQYAKNFICSNGAPGYIQNESKGKISEAGGDCVNFMEVLITCWKETGDEEMLEYANKMSRWTIRFMNKWKWNVYCGNSYGWHFMMRGMLATYKATGSKPIKDWYLSMSRKNMTYPQKDINHTFWMDWLISEAQKMTGMDWLLEEDMRRTTFEIEEKWQEDGSIAYECKYPWSKWRSYWTDIYFMKTFVCYTPVMTARRKALGLPD
ncbi:MAG: hypothetical protein SNJ70_10840, partial [Armatimonadota bacterium]